MRAEGKHCLFNVVECPSCALMLPRVHCPDRNTSHCFINGLTGKRPRLWSWGWICSVAPSLLEMRVTVLQASVMWCLIFQQVTGRGLWGAEEPHGGLAGVLYPMALKLHLCSAPQSWPLPELLHSYGHTNLPTQCVCPPADITVTTGLIWPWGQPVSLLCSFFSHTAECFPSQQ